MLPIAIDAMGGDRAPDEILLAAHAAAAEGIPVVLVGPADLIGVGDLPLIVASEVITMDEDAAQGVRRKKDSTLVRAAEAVRDGHASAMISAGNTGATMASALLRMGRIKGVSRPAIATPLPVPGHAPNILLDAGANAEVQPEWLVQFAQMGSVYSRVRFGVANPKVGLLSIGEEPGKGDNLRKEAYELLLNAPNINFIGNVEGRDILKGEVDVVVTDGFTGNVVLKLAESVVGHIAQSARREIGRSLQSRLGALLMRPAFERLKKQFDYAEYGGAPLLGVDGVIFIGHGRSTPRAIRSAIRSTATFVEQRVNAHILDLLRTAHADQP